MAMIRWLSQLPSRDLPGTMRPMVMAIGFVIHDEVSSEMQLYATDPLDVEIHADQRVSLLVQWSDRSSGESEIELRSSEPMLKPHTRCEAAASQLKSMIQPC